MKGDPCHVGKRRKDRLTIPPCAMDGVEKMPLLVIGKSIKPHCFKRVKLCLLLTMLIKDIDDWIYFHAWVREHDRKFHDQNRQVAIVIDNCPVHPHVLGLKTIKPLFLPPNTQIKLNRWIRAGAAPACHDRVGIS